jgi:uroporphyrinogen-III synthase
VAALKLLALRPTLVAPSPNTWRELLAATDQSFDVGGKRVYVQEYGAENVELMQGLRQRGAIAEGIGVYRWALPEDTSELEAALRRLAAGEVDAAVFTSAHQVHNVLALAQSLGLDAAIEALRKSVVVASVGPVTSLALERAEIAVDLCPDSPKMGPLVVSLSRRARALCERKRGATPPVDLPRQRDNG